MRTPFLAQLADVEFKLELIAEETREGVDDDNLEHGRLEQRRVNHGLECGTAVIGRRASRLHELLSSTPTLAGAVGLKLAALVRDG
jgi:hypothetical protein